MADTTTIVKYYQDTLLYQWVNAPRARGTIGAFVQCAICDLLIHDVRDAYDLETAVGPQLDVVGEYMGLSRTVYGTIDRPYFQLDNYLTGPDLTLIGTTDYTDSTVNASSATYRYGFASEAAYNLENEEYRIMLKFKVTLNSGDMTFYAIQNALWATFGSSILAFDGTDMTMGYYVSAASARYAEIALGMGIMPKPMGVGLSGVFSVPNPLEVFGFQDSAHPNSNTTGFGDSTTGGDEGFYFLQTTDQL